MDERKCARCEQVKLLSNFGKKQRGPNECHRERTYQRKEHCPKKYRKSKEVETAVSEMLL